ncbi:uncharacterized protein LOC124349040 isoform X1 [Daphnia pulicaria]|uniref:uncharacterized protein LOC124349040 isoform X1 n=1 Tax=Daphnia pulicaria TaxID=35523 RepID=UPI001EEB68B3|nr:uncharacterized protein LOC124349040 isoform X1 [Daphnia pulicaria]XP_046655490.1 uncharacterized protein LOC124349040 isoform X1 [Daphnia pulicaria]
MVNYGVVSLPGVVSLMSTTRENCIKGKSKGDRSQSSEHLRPGNSCILRRIYQVAITVNYGVVQLLVVSSISGWTTGVLMPLGMADTNNLRNDQLLHRGCTVRFTVTPQLMLLRATTPKARSFILPRATLPNRMCTPPRLLSTTPPRHLRLHNYVWNGKERGLFFEQDEFYCNPLKIAAALQSYVANASLNLTFLVGRPNFMMAVPSPTTSVLLPQVVNENLCQSLIGVPKDVHEQVPLFRNSDGPVLPNYLSQLTSEKVEAADVNVLPTANVEGVILEDNNLIKVNATLTLNDGQKIPILVVIESMLSLKHDRTSDWL